MPTSAANFVELEALRWENRKLSDAKAVAETEVRPAAAMPHLQALLCAKCCVFLGYCQLYKAVVSVRPDTPVQDSHQRCIFGRLEAAVRPCILICKELTEPVSSLH